MLFNSFEFIIFLPIVFAIYWSFSNNLKIQNSLVVIASYIFYGWWNWYFLSLIIFSTLLDYFIGRRLLFEENPKQRKVLLFISIIINLGFLGIFKYYNFFLESFISSFAKIGLDIEGSYLNIILPVGISFYTFQTLSYTIDVYKKSITPTKNLISFAAYVCFFPQLVAGPIERATSLLPQILNKREFKYEQGVQGLRLILWGMFKKVVIADSLAPLVNDIFQNYEGYDGGILWLGAIYFSFQIYCDFSAYSDIAIGTSKLFGFELMSNFKFPYFSRNIGEFWKRWHISLSTWFRDYLYIPLGGSKVGKIKSLKNITLVFLISGLWHGANWTFVIWGGIHAILYVPLFFLKINRKYSGAIVAENSILPSLKESFLMLMNFLFVTIAWVFFRSETVLDSINYINKMFLMTKIPSSKLQGVGFILILVLIEWFLRKDERLSEISEYRLIRFLFYIFLMFHTVKYFGLIHADFIYFQF